MQWQIFLAGALFLIVYGIIISEKIHRTIIAMAGAVLLIVTGVLTQENAIKYIDFNTLGLLIGMMIIVGITQKSGVFEYMAIKAAHQAKGDPIKILVSLATITAVASGLLDNVTTVLLVVPVTLSITYALEINPIPFLFSEILASNIGGTATLIGDPPNIMIGSATGFGFIDFIKYDAPVIVVIFIVTILILRLIYRKQLVADPANQAKVAAMDPDQAIKDPVLLKKCLWVIGIVIVGFVLHQFLHLESATIALAGAALLLLLTRQDPEEVFHTVEWPTLFFFIGLFILVGGLVQTGIITSLAKEAVAATNGNLTATTMLILWFSAIASAFVDNIPFVATFIPLIKDIGSISGMDVFPLWWALSLGACLGGNGTIIGASANVVVSGIAAREGYPMTFWGFMKLAFPLMLVSILISTVYLLIFFL
ncbi:MAG: SLC13 family permease [Methylocystaceae bacterium]